MCCVEFIYWGSPSSAPRRTLPRQSKSFWWLHHWMCSLDILHSVVKDTFWSMNICYSHKYIDISIQIDIYCGVWCIWRVRDGCLTCLRPSQLKISSPLRSVMSWSGRNILHAGEGQPLEKPLSNFLNWCFTERLNTMSTWRSTYFCLGSIHMCLWSIVFCSKIS